MAEQQISMGMQYQAWLDMKQKLEEIEAKLDQQTIEDGAALTKLTGSIVEEFTLTHGEGVIGSTHIEEQHIIYYPDYVNYNSPGGWGGGSWSGWQEWNKYKQKSFYIWNRYDVAVQFRIGVKARSWSLMYLVDVTLASGEEILIESESHPTINDPFNSVVFHSYVSGDLPTTGTLQLIMWGSV